jgi:diacylglycerol kinase family enzyme
MNAIVLLNSGAGTFSAYRRTSGERLIADALRSVSIDADLRVVRGARLAAEAEVAAKAPVDVVVAGGGDGTLSTVAGVLAGKPMPLGILPLGTFNHFAKDLGIPLDLEGAAGVIAARSIGSVDVGEVNNRVFINNSSLGIYPRIVLERETLRRRHRVRQWFAMAWAVFKVFRRFPMVSVRIGTGDTTLLRKTPLVFIGNNQYQLDLLHVGSRPCLDRGELSLYVANAHNRWGMLKLTVRSLLGGLDQTRDFNSFCLSSCSIESRHRRLHVAADGEVMKAVTPLHYRIRAGALRVCLPRIRGVDPAAARETHRPELAAASGALSRPTE